MCQCRESQLLTVRGHAGRLDDAYLYRTIFHAQTHIQIWSEIAGDLGLERDLSIFARRRVDIDESCLPRSLPLLWSRRESIVGQEIAGKQRFLIIALYGIFQPVLFSTLQIPDA